VRRWAAVPLIDVLKETVLRTWLPAGRSASARRCFSDRIARDRRVMTSTSPARR